MILNIFVNQRNFLKNIFNGIIINRQKWSEQKVQDGDKIEIVTIVGGGGPLREVK